MPGMTIMIRTILLGIMAIFVVSVCEAENIVLENDGIRAVINSRTGAVDKLVSLQPSPLVVSDKGGGLRLVAVDPGNGKRIVFDRLVRLTRKGDNRVEAVFTCADKDLASLLSVVITYEMKPNELRTTCLVRYLKDRDGPLELLFGQKNVGAEDWQVQTFPGLFGNLDVLSQEYRKRAKQIIGLPGIRVFERFNDHPNDATVVPKDVPKKLVRYPYGILEGRDRFFLYGKMDINGYVYLTPNYRGMNPCMLITPKAMRKGKSYLFDMTYMFFDKKKYYFSDVCRWYAENLYSTNRISRGIVRLPKNLKPRTLAEPGNIAGLGIPYGFEKHGREMIAKQKIVDAFAQRAGVAHLWGGWLEWNEIPTTDPSWVDKFGYRMTDKEVRAEIKRRHDLGYTDYGYRRQLFPSLGFFEDRPWKREWMLRTKPGTVFVCPSGPEPEDNLPYGDSMPIRLQEYLKKDLGLKIPRRGRDSWVHGDFSIDELREFYVKKLDAWIDKYQGMGGFAFDMGWDIHTVPSLAYPEDGTHHGIVAVMSKVYRYVHKKYPSKRILMNMLQGSPSNLWCDLTMFEGGVDITYRGVESVKIYRTTMVGYYYLWQHRSVFGKKKAVKQLKYHMLRNLSWGVCLGFGDTLAFATDPELNSITDFYRIASRLTSIPLVIENAALKIKDARTPKITGSIFARDKTIYVLIFNDRSVPAKIDAVVDKNYLKAYGSGSAATPGRSFYFDKDCRLVKDKDFKVVDEGRSFHISGTLGPKELVILTNSN